MADVLTKVCNALFTDADVSAAAGSVIPSSTIPLMRRLFGGLWVGGTATLSHDTLRFDPNDMNRAMHATDVSFTLPLREITGIRLERGILTKIVVVSTLDGERRLRCFGAAGLADAIEGARRGSRS